MGVCLFFFCDHTLVGPLLTLLIWLKNPQQGGGVQSDHFTNFRPTKQKLLNLE
jgi:hypothetical protein